MTTTVETPKPVPQKPYLEHAFGCSRIWFDAALGGVTMAHADIRDATGAHTVMALDVPPEQHLDFVLRQAIKDAPIAGVCLIAEAWFLPLELQTDEARSRDWSEDPAAYEVLAMYVADGRDCRCYHARITHGETARTLGPWELIESRGEHPFARLMAKHGVAP